MKSSLLIGLACLILGILGAFGYSHYLGEGKQLAQVQADLSAAQASITKLAADALQAKSETDSMSAQIQQLTATKDDLTKQVALLKSAPPTAPATDPAPANPMAGMAGFMKTAMEQHTQQQLLLLKARLHLTPEQEVAVKAALDAEAKRGEEMQSKMFSGGKIDPLAVAAEFKGVKTLDQTLDDILTPDQKTTYQQMKTEQKNSATEMMANVELNQISPYLQLSETQKDQVYNALYQAQLDTQDPNWIKNNVGANATNPTAILDAQAKAKEDALAKVLTPDQLATYHQQAQSQLEMQRTMMQKFSQPTPGTGTAPASTSAK
jgi:hypothetical protein